MEPIPSHIMLRFRRLFSRNKISLLESDCFSFGSKDILALRTIDSHKVEI